MYLNLLTVCILNCFYGMNANDTKEKPIQSNSVIDNVAIPPNNSSIKVPKMKVVKNEKDSCLVSVQQALEYDKLCEPLKTQLDMMRCDLINATANDVCISSTVPEWKRYTQSASDLCEKTFKVNESRLIPPLVAVFLEDWRKPGMYSCKNICPRSDKSYYNVCSFMLGYYTEPTVESKVELSASAKAKPNPISNDGGIKNSGSVALPNVEENESLNPDNEFDNPEIDKNPSDVGNEEKTGNNPEAKEENQRKRVLDDQNQDLAEQNSPDQKPVPPKENPVNDEEDQERKNPKISESNDQYVSQGKIPVNSSKFDSEGDSHAFLYFALVSGVCIAFYLMMYNKKKILAFMIEGRRRNVKRRPNSAAYSKLDCNLEEAMASGPSTSVSNTLLY